MPRNDIYVVCAETYWDEHCKVNCSSRRRSFKMQDGVTMVIFDNAWSQYQRDSMNANENVTVYSHACALQLMNGASTSIWANELDLIV
jgi:hypothetical protein